MLAKASARNNTDLSTLEQVECEERRQACLRQGDIGEGVHCVAGDALHIGQ